MLNCMASIALLFICLIRASLRDSRSHDLPVSFFPSFSLLLFFFARVIIALQNAMPSIKL